MTNGIEVFDTDFISEYIRDNPEAIERFGRTPFAQRFTTLANEAELIGPRYRQLLTAANEMELMRAQIHLNRVREVLNNAFSGILPTDLRVGHIFAELKQNKNLSKVEHADLLIAALALRNNATLVTGNVEHFRKVPHLKVEGFRQ